MKYAVVGVTFFVLWMSSPIELRHFISAAKQQTIKKVLMNEDGRFDLGVVKRAEYRLLLSPHRGFKQATNSYALRANVL